MFEELERKLALQIESQLLWQLESELVLEERSLEPMRSQLEGELPKQLRQTKGQLLELLQLVAILSLSNS